MPLFKAEVIGLSSTETFMALNGQKTSQRPQKTHRLGSTSICTLMGELITVHHVAMEKVEGWHFPTLSFVLLDTILQLGVLGLAEAGLASQRGSARLWFCVSILAAYAWASSAL